MQLTVASEIASKVTSVIAVGELYKTVVTKTIIMQPISM